MDRRNAPDDELLDASVCGCRIGILSVGIYCDRGPSHGGRHGATVGASLSRGLGTADDVTSTIGIEWDDDRPAATVGDVRRLIRENA